MTTVINRTLILAAAAMTLGMTAASAQTNTRFKAEIPFAFQIGNQSYDAGSYDATVGVSTGGFRTLLIRAAGSSGSKLAMSTGSLSPVAAHRELTGPKMVFRCGDSACVLTQVWPGNAPEGLLFNAPKSTAAGTQRLAVVRMQTLNAD